jgi:Zn-dependent oligopeptidase
MKRYGLPEELVLRHALPHFGHIFSSDQYAAKYYSYLWADVLAADAREAFLEQGGWTPKKPISRSAGARRAWERCSSTGASWRDRDSVWSRQVASMAAWGYSELSAVAG